MILETIKRLLAEQFSVEEDSITLETDFASDLNADSLDAVEFVMALEEEFDLKNLAEEDIKKFKTVGDVVDYVKKQAD
ncbi:MAG: acyl carrier protein [Clostridiales bacterium]|jgi:acyl carrier protein|nr:acyl carrier protein [Clostridiales bacterium]